MKKYTQAPGDTRRRRQRIIWRLLVIMAAAVLVIALYQLFSIFSEYREAAQEYEALEQYVSVDEDIDDGETDSVNAADPGPDIDFESLQAQYEDLIGWLVIDAIDVSYPIMQSTDNDYYLHRTTEGTYNFAGSIFLDCANSADFSDCNSIIYGHNMKDGSMFGSLKKFRQEEVYERDLTFWVCTPEENYRYQIFSAYETAVGSGTYTLFSGTGSTFSEYLETVAGLSEIPAGELRDDAECRVVTLSTCTGNSSTRFVIQGVYYEQ